MALDATMVDEYEKYMLEKEVEISMVKIKKIEIQTSKI